MDALRPFHIVESDDAGVRLAAASSFLQTFPADQSITLVGATRGAADDFARTIARARRATFGLQRLSLTQLAARTAMVALACGVCAEYRAWRRGGGDARRVRGGAASARVFRSGRRHTRISAGAGADAAELRLKGWTAPAVALSAGRAGSGGAARTLRRCFDS